MPLGKRKRVVVEPESEEEEQQPSDDVASDDAALEIQEQESEQEQPEDEDEQQSKEDPDEQASKEDPESGLEEEENEEMEEQEEEEQLEEQAEEEDSNLDDDTEDEGESDCTLPDIEQTRPTPSPPVLVPVQPALERSKRLRPPPSRNEEEEEEEDAAVEEAYVLEAESEEAAIPEVLRTNWRDWNPEADDPSSHIRLQRVVACLGPAPVDILPPLAGIIESLELINFMCHKHLFLMFNTSINFIIGSNGSGKSAIMTSLMLALGSKAADTARGRNLGSFVSIGANSAKIIVTLQNAGPAAHEPSLYGHKIVVTRTISKAGVSKTFLKCHDHQGIARDIPVMKREMQGLNTAFKLKFPNPFALMSQETMKTFLSNSTPKEMYELVLQGTGIKEAIDLHQLLRDKILVFAKKAKFFKSEIEHLITELHNLNAKKEMFKSMATARKTIEDFEKGIIWCRVHEEEENEKRLVEEYSNLQTTMKEKHKYLDQLRDNQASRDMMLEKIDHDLEAAEMKNRSQCGESKRCKEKLAKYEAELTELDSSLAATSRQIQVVKTECRAVQDGLNQMNKHSMAEEMARRKKQKDDATQLQSGLKAIQASKVSVMSDIDRLNESMRITKVAMNEKREIIATLKKQNQKEQAEVENAKKEASAIPAVYGSKMPEFLRVIDKFFREGKFSKKPIGPIGLHIKVKDQKWALALEVCLRSEMRNFYCNSMEDATLLKKLSKQYLTNEPTVVCGKFTSTLYNVVPNKAKAPEGMVNFLDVLDIAMPEVTNYLVDQRLIEQIILCPVDKFGNALSMMKASNTVPKRCNVIVTIEGEMIYPYPLFRYYTADYPNVKFLVKNKEDGLRVSEHAISEREREIANVIHDVHQLTLETQGIKMQLGLAKSQKEKLAQREISIRRQVDACRLEELEVSKDTFTQLQQQIADYNEKLTELDNEKKATEDKIAKVKVNFKEVKDRLGRIPRIEEIQKAIGSIQDKRRGIETKSKTETANEAFTIKKLGEMSAKSKRLQTDIANQKKIVEKLIKVASKHCPRIEMNMSASQLENELQQARTYLKSLNPSNDDEPEVLEQYDRCIRQLNRLQEHTNLVSQSLRHMSQALNSRKSQYNNKIILIFLQISEMFKLFFQEQSFIGQIEFNHVSKTMQVGLFYKIGHGVSQVLEPMSNPSGGERSFTTIALILSVWDRLRFPFYVLDEFDVFMDVINRQTCLELLINMAKLRPRNQFIFLTPQNLNLQANAEVSIHQLEHPRPNQVTSDLDRRSSTVPALQN